MRLEKSVFIVGTGINTFIIEKNAEVFGIFKPTSVLFVCFANLCPLAVEIGIVFKNIGPFLHIAGNCETINERDYQINRLT